MSLAPILNATVAIQIHVVAITAAVVLTVFQLLGKKGVTLHRVLGYSWASAMIIAAASSFFIHTIRMIGPFSPIHILSVFTLITVPLGVRAARHHDIGKHKTTMLSLIIFALGGAGLFALFVPGRIMFRVLFGG